MYEFGASQMLGMIVFMVSKMKQSIGKGFRSMKQDLESFGLWLENWIWKIKKRQ